ncbi:MAG: di-trans,poly-cis-decaprenylcistransferase [Spirochaetales bacterium]|nr:di-trans,poly-cis-decaprenylcistransferase [Leptospiraceae bacterium]MCP5480778.1 di-trans,poly-cis-decaprenylcistransferase [Spirochaetales bacterium]
MKRSAKARHNPSDRWHRLDFEKLPRHVAIILDGNGRWARKRGLSRSEGHRAGGETLDRLLDSIVSLGIPVISLYAFSTENWRRPRAEVSAIWNLMGEFFDTRLDRCHNLGIQIRASGDLRKIPARGRKKIEAAVAATAGYKTLVANFCVNYGSRDEILHAARAVIRDRLSRGKRVDAPIPAREFEKNLYTHGLPDVDLLVRPGGEMRVSNFLLWQIAYAEIYVTETLWPDFDEENLVQALLWFQGRERRFGGL